MGFGCSTGYKQLGLPIHKLSRAVPTYSAWRRWLMLIDSITAFSETPLVGIFYLGLIISGLSAVVGAWLLVRRLFFGSLLQGWVSVMISVWFLGGMLIFCVGIIGIYISKIFIETKGRPYTIVRKLHGRRATEYRTAAPNIASDQRPRNDKARSRGRHGCGGCFNRIGRSCG